MSEDSPISHSSARTSRAWLPCASRGTNEARNWWIAGKSAAAGAGDGEARRAEQRRLDAGQVGVHGGLPDRLERAGRGPLVAPDGEEAAALEQVGPRLGVERA